MKLKYLVETLAYRFKDNALAKIFVRPFFRSYRALVMRRRSKYFNIYGQELLKTFKGALDEQGIFFWLEFGTLLGAYREHDFISHDCDLDVGTYYGEQERIKEALIRNGFSLKREFIVDAPGYKGLEQTYSFKRVSIDIFYFKREATKLYCNSFIPNVNLSEPDLAMVKEITVPDNGFAAMEFKGMSFNVPSPTEVYLKAHYGENFMIPNPKFNEREEATNVRYFMLDELHGRRRIY